MLQAKGGPKRRRAPKVKGDHNDHNPTPSTQFRGPVVKERSDGTSSVSYQNQDFAIKLSGSSSGRNTSTTEDDMPLFMETRDNMDNYPDTGSHYYNSAEADHFQQQFMDGVIPEGMELDTAPMPEMSNSSIPSKTQIDYINDFVSKIDVILPATIALEYLDGDQRQCRGCPEGSRQIGLWRCKDCFDPGVYCRGCMRKQHMSNPFHHIECWLGDHFRSAALWEVGVFIAVPHHLEETRKSCTARQSEVNYIESLQVSQDYVEKQKVASKIYPLEPNPGDSVSAPDGLSAAGDVSAAGYMSAADEANEDAIFEQQLQEAYERYGEKGRGEDPHPSNNPPLTEPDVRQHGHQRELKRIVHTNGIHYLQVHTCSCSGSTGMLADLVACSLMPASFSLPKTFFTRHLLDFSRLCNLELKCSLYQFHQLLQRLTLPLSPAMVKNLYNEFRRMCRLWRWLKKMKWAGVPASKDIPRAPASGKYAIFCATCPQPGINLPADWVDDADNPIYGRTFVADGNFKADHLEQTGQDVPLYDGAGIMPKSAEYHKHLNSVTEIRTATPCDNTFRAIEAAMSASKSCDITGVVGIACARHGCYCPNGMVDLQRGEQQKNVDYAFVKSIQHTNVDIRQKVTLLYDIACQYFVHLRGRIDPLLAAGKQDLRNLVIDRAIGLFHVHAHKDQCFFRFSPTFIPGLGTVAGEILESLWSALNEISISLRTSSVSYRAEMLDDHATDSNHKKMLNMAASLANFHRVAAETSAEHRSIFQEINARAQDLGLANQWEQSIAAAEQERMQNPEVMDIYGVDLSKVETVPNVPAASDPAAALSAVEAYFEHALQIEERQIELQVLVQKAGNTPSEPDLKMMMNRRESLRGLITQLPRLIADAGLEYSPASINANLGMDTTGLPEEHVLCFPSNRNMVQNHTSTELARRVAQATLQLNQIRELIVEKSIQYSHIIRIAKSKAITTRSRQKVNDISDRLNLHCSIYQTCRSKMEILGADQKLLDYYQILARKDLNASTALLLPNARKSTEMSLTLSWIWRSRAVARTGQQPAGDAGHDRVAVQEFLRVHWLRSRALSQRWAEELILLSHEMQWTVRFYLYKANEWRSAAVKDISNPAAAYARRKRDCWLKLAVQADILFRQTTYEYKSPMPTQKATR